MMGLVLGEQSLVGVGSGRPMKSMTINLQWHFDEVSEL